MGCVFQNPLTVDQLYTQIDGEAPPEVLDHLQKCDFCRARRDAIREFLALLRTHLHPTVQDLVDFETNFLAEPLRIVIARHLETCAECKRHIAEITTLNNLPFEEDSGEDSDQSQTTEPPTIQPQGKILVFPAVKLIPGRVVSLDEAMLTASGNPSYDAPSHEHITTTLRFEGVDILLTLETVQDGIIVSGHLLTEQNQDQEQWQDAIIRLTSKEGQISASTLIDPHGEFTFSPVFPPGAAEMVIRSRHQQVIQADITLPIED